MATIYPCRGSSMTGAFHPGDMRVARDIAFGVVRVSVMTIQEMMVQYVRGPRGH